MKNPGIKCRLRQDEPGALANLHKKKRLVPANDPNDVSDLSFWVETAVCGFFNVIIGIAKFESNSIFPKIYAKME
jgi:hypothetical protein